MTPSRPTSGEAALRTAAKRCLGRLDVMVARQTLTGAVACRDDLRAALAATPTPTPGLTRATAKGTTIDVDEWDRPLYVATPTPTPGLDCTTDEMMPGWCSTHHAWFHPYDRLSR